MLQILVNTHEIKESPRAVSQEIPRDWLDLVLGGDRATDFRAAAGARFAATLARVGGGKFLLEAKLDIRLEGNCRRCLAPVPVQLAVPFLLTLLRGGSEPKTHAPRGSEAIRPEPEVFEELADEETFEGDELDLLPILREQILLALPAAPLCAEECLGLCPTCGQNRNERECGHGAAPLDPRWEKLRNVKVDFKK